MWSRIPLQVTGKKNSSLALKTVISEGQKPKYSTKHVTGSSLGTKHVTGSSLGTQKKALGVSSPACGRIL